MRHETAEEAVGMKGKDALTSTFCEHPMQDPDDIAWTTRYGETKVFCPEDQGGVNISWCACCEYRKQQEPKPEA